MFVLLAVHVQQVIMWFEQHNRNLQQGLFAQPTAASAVHACVA